jgi:hypothetical protein
MNCLKEPNSIAVVVCAIREQWLTVSHTMHTWWAQVGAWWSQVGPQIEVILGFVVLWFALSKLVTGLLNREAGPDNQHGR